MSGCTVVALEGAHGTGKSTLAYAIVAHYKARSVNATLVSETARRSPFVEDVVIRRSGAFGLEAEIELFASHIVEEQLTARNHELLISDKTLANVVGYARLMLSSTNISGNLIQAMVGFTTAYSKFYDAVFYLSDMHDPALTNDPYRPVDRQFQANADHYILQACEEVGLSLISVPEGLALEDQVKWISEAVDGIRR